MARKRVKIDELKMNMTPLIDVTFLILIFLMVLPFKTLERKVAAFLPKDRGLAKTAIKLEEKPKMEVVLKRTKGETSTQVIFMNEGLGVDDAGFARLEQEIAATHGRDAEIPGEIFAWPWVPHQDVIRAVDAFMKSKVLEITFVGTPDKGDPMSGRGDTNPE